MKGDSEWMRVNCQSILNSRFLLDLSLLLHLQVFQVKTTYSFSDSFFPLFIYSFFNFSFSFLSLFHRNMDNVVVRAGREYEITARRLINWDGGKPCYRRNASKSVLSLSLMGPLMLELAQQSTLFSRKSLKLEYMTDVTSIWYLSIQRGNAHLSDFWVSPSLSLLIGYGTGWGKLYGRKE